MTAWGDESGSQPDRDPDTYLIAAALCDEDDVPEIRKTMESLRLTTEKKVHWHGSSADRRHDLVEAVAALPLAGLVVIHTEAAVSDRRHRRKCLEYLLPNLAEMPCSHITLESRSHLDASDVDILQKFRAQKVITSSLRVNHAVGMVEPALWVADIVCGAVVQSGSGIPATWRNSQVRSTCDRFDPETTRATGLVVRRVVLWLTSSPTSMGRLHHGIYQSRRICSKEGVIHLLTGTDAQSSASGRM
ncbi:hypothetical protein OPAG_06572 [Rhodococcus opacus PD630]|nr:hypothetical protein OPAG_06572 [Rhodococcus opacus PD630]